MPEFDKEAKKQMTQTLKMKSDVISEFEQMTKKGGSLEQKLDEQISRQLKQVQLDLSFTQRAMQVQ